MGTKLNAEKTEKLFNALNSWLNQRPISIIEITLAPGHIIVNIDQYLMIFMMHATYSIIASIWN